MYLSNYSYISVYTSMYVVYTCTVAKMIVNMEILLLHLCARTSMQEKHDLLDLNVRLDEELKYMLGREDALSASHEPTPPVSPSKVPSAAVASPLREQVAAVALQQQLDKVRVRFIFSRMYM